jgi:hypothetical protein
MPKLASLSLQDVPANRMIPAARVSSGLGLLHHGPYCTFAVFVLGLRGKVKAPRAPNKIFLRTQQANQCRLNGAFLTFPGS